MASLVTPELRCVLHLLPHEGTAPFLMTNRAKIRWDDARGVFVDQNDRVLAAYNPLSATRGRLDEFQDVTAGELLQALGHAATSVDDRTDPTAAISISYLPSDVGVYRAAWAANYPYPEDMLSIDWRGGRVEFTIEVVLPRKSNFTDKVIRSMTEPLLAAKGMTCIETRFYDDSSDGGACELTVLPPAEATVREMAFMVSQLRDIVMNEPLSATPVNAFAAIESGEIQFMLGTVESETLDAKASHYSKHDRSRIVIAGDVAAFANSAKGGIIVIGARTVKDLHGRDIIAEINGTAIDVGATDRYRKAVEDLVFPEVAGIKMCRAPAALGEVVALLIPAQHPDRLPFIVRAATQTEGRMSSALFQVPVRYGDSNIPARIETIHRRLRRIDQEDQ
ncbi:AlbA family DNA-binding domain-containing protein [Nocardia nova]|uniref:AlbA family DNA-binding domain-containing protein n=1 Tax=Nocardia nova TaxID=37330 RepID=UPI000AF8E5FF|nr:ATP-binding protein [Nocardia nova]